MTHPTHPTQPKAEVIEDFDHIAARYDLLTRMNPGYLTHLAWSAQRLRLAPGATILDLCCGTGLSTRALLATYPDAAEIIGLDASAGMLAHAQRTVRAKGPRPRISFVLGDATDPRPSLAPYLGERRSVDGRGQPSGPSVDGRGQPSGPSVDGRGQPSGPSVDGILMAYGIRNVPDPDRCLAALYELLAPGAPICFHEYSVADSPRARAIWNAVALSVITPLGALATRNLRMWRYLRQSVNRFDGVAAFEERLARHGFVDVQTLPMSGWQRGIVHSFLARRPRDLRPQPPPVGA